MFVKAEANLRCRQPKLNGRTKVNFDLRYMNTSKASLLQVINATEAVME